MLSYVTLNTFLISVCASLFLLSAVRVHAGFCEIAVEYEYLFLTNKEPDVLT